MSIQAIAWVLNNSRSRLAARHVLLSIANHCDKYGENAFPSIETIASEARLSSRQVQRCLPKLVDSDELTIELGGGLRGANLYCLVKMRDDILSSLSPEMRQKIHEGATNDSPHPDKLGAAIRKNRPEPSVNPTPLPSTVRLAELLKSCILRNNPSARITPIQLRQWALIADRMIQLDGRTAEQIESLIRWSQDDEFWHRNILSMNKLREKFDQLTLNSARQANWDTQSDREPIADQKIGPPRWPGLLDSSARKERQQ